MEINFFEGDGGRVLAPHGGLGFPIWGGGVSDLSLHLIIKNM